MLQPLCTKTTKPSVLCTQLRFCKSTCFRLFPLLVARIIISTIWYFEYYDFTILGILKMQLIKQKVLFQSRDFFVCSQRNGREMQNKTHVRCCSDLLSTLECDLVGGGWLMLDCWPCRVLVKSLQCTWYDFVRRHHSSTGKSPGWFASLYLYIGCVYF